MLFLNVDKNELSFLVSDDELKEYRYINEKKHNFHHAAKSLEAHGYTEKSFEWSMLNYRGYKLDEVKTLDVSLASLWKNINPNEDIPFVNKEEEFQFAEKLLNDMNEKLAKMLKK